MKRKTPPEEKEIEYEDVSEEPDLEATFDECVAQGLLRRMPPSERQAVEQLKKARVLLEEGKKALEAGLPNAAMVSGYSAILDAGRAVLYRDGFREKSHACVARYLEAKYGKEIGAASISLLDEYRDRRHKTLYSSDYYPTLEEAKRVVLFAEEFVAKAGKLI